MTSKVTYNAHKDYFGNEASWYQKPITKDIKKLVVQTMKPKDYYKDIIHFSEDEEY